MRLVSGWKDSWSPCEILWGTTEELGCPYIVNLIEEQILKRNFSFKDVYKHPEH